MAKKRTRVNPFTTVIAILIIAAAALFGTKFIFDQQKDDDVKNTTSTTTAEAATKQEQTTEEESTTEAETPESKTPTQNDGEDPNTLDSLTGTVTTARVSGSNLILRVNINQYLTAGTCNLILTHQASGATYAASANLIASASTSTCEGFDIPVSELSSGTYGIKINIASGDKTGIITGEYSL